MRCWWTACGALAACASSPLDTLPVADPPRVTARQRFELTLGDDVLGVIERVVGDGEVVQRRWQRVVAGGEVVDLVRATRAAPGDAWLFDGLRWQRAAPALGDAPLPPGVHARALPFEAVAEPVWVAATGGFWAGELAGDAQFDGEGLVELTVGEVHQRRVGEVPAWEPVDLDQRLFVPTGALEAPRRRRVGRFEVDGAVVAVHAVLEAEIRRGPPPVVGADDALGAFVAGAVGDAPDDWTAVERVVRAVAATIADGPSPGLTPVEALLTGAAGDCSEHVDLLLAAAARAGWPARRVAGLLAAEGAHGPGLYPHVWAEVRVGDRWVAVDPTLGQAPADAARLPLAERIDVAMDRAARGADLGLVELR